MDTELLLLNWRSGAIQAERLMAAVLSIEMFEQIDPQAPLGGPDGKKDIICQKHGVRFVAACYFPPTESTSAEIRTKFDKDIAGVGANGADGFVFFTNQRMSTANRAAIVAEFPGIQIEIYHLERIRSVLDSPIGYGIRLDFLKIPMALEEQLSYFSQYNRLVYEIAKKKDEAIGEIGKKIDQLLMRTMAIENTVNRTPSRFESEGDEVAIELVTRKLTENLVKWVHAVVSRVRKAPEVEIGEFRKVRVWIGTARSTPETAAYVPPDPDQIMPLIRDLCDDWNSEFLSLLSSTDMEKVKAISRFHHVLLQIHPFLDFNGQVAIEISKQQCKDLIGRPLAGSFLSDRELYYSALRAADRGLPAELEMLFQVSLF
jgi:hypothetical protein